MGTLPAVCGRYASVTPPEQLAERFGVDHVRTEDLGTRYNVAPSMPVYAVIEHEGDRRLGALRWGYVPHWSEGPRSGPSPINARLEGIAESRMFAASFASRRCIVPADGFYEWQEQDGERPKQPYHLHDPEGEPLALGGIWTAWRGGDDGPLYSCAIVTTAASGEIAAIHGRMPVMLPERLWPTWLAAGPEEAPHLRATVQELGPPRLTARPISDAVNNVRNDGPQLWEPGAVR